MYAASPHPFLSPSRCWPVSSFMMCAPMHPERVSDTSTPTQPAEDGATHKEQPEEAKPGAAAAHTQQDGAGLDDDFLVNSYKVVQCKRKYAHDWASCPCAHKGERAARRDLQLQPYMAVACQYAKPRLPCPMGERCPNAHNLFEYWLHPQRFKTELCQFGANCDRPVCFFSHSAADLRPLDASLPPAEACWSAGAAISSSRSSYHGSQHYRHAQQQPQQQCYVQAPGVVPGFMAGDAAAASGVMGGARHPALGPQQQQHMMMSALPGAGMPGVMHQTPHQQQQQQQQWVMLQPGHTAAGLVGVQGGMNGSAGMLPTNTFMLSPQQMQPAPQLQVQGYTDLTATNPTAQYVWVQATEAAAGSSSSSGSGSGSATQYVAAGPVHLSMGLPTTTMGPPVALQQPVPGQQLISSVVQQQQQQGMVGAGLTCTFPTSPMVQGQAQSLPGAAAGLLPVQPFGSEQGQQYGVVACTGFPAALPGSVVSQGVGAMGPSSNGWQQYPLYSANTSPSLQGQAVDTGVLVDFQSMQLAPGM